MSREALLLRNNRNCGRHREALRDGNSLYRQGAEDCRVGLRPPRNDEVHKIKCYELLFLLWLSSTLGSSLALG